MTLRQTPSHPEDIRYLAFEGGGGKGVAYLGAIQALERTVPMSDTQRSVLPIRIGEPNHIRGIAGASAGGITALFLTLGFTSADLQHVLSRSETFEAFFDGPDNNLQRHVLESNQMQYGQIIEGTPNSLEKILADRRRTISPKELLSPLVLPTLAAGGFAGGIRGALIGLGTGLALPAVLLSLLNGKLNRVSSSDPAMSPIISRIQRHLEGYFYNIVFDRGVFPGFAARSFFHAVINDFVARERPALIPQLERDYRENPAAPFRGVTFRTLHEITGVKLLLVGVNITTMRPGYFSHTHTPHFPVAEAVALSMSIPFVFKPVRIDAAVEVEDNPYAQHEADYRGLWVDGGTLMNLPLHAFDNERDNTLRLQQGLANPLHPNTLGIRLMDGFENPLDAANYADELRQRQNEKALKETGKPAEPIDDPSQFQTFIEHLQSVLGTLMSSSEEGQFRTPEEQLQAIHIYSDGLDTLNFTPDQSQMAGPINSAYNKMVDKFGRTSFRL